MSNSNSPGFWKKLSSAFSKNAPQRPDDYPDFQTAYSAGFAHFRERRYEEAARAFSKAIQFNPDDTCSWEMFGSALGNQGRFEESLAAFARVLELGHECESCWYNRSIAHWALGRREETLRALERVVAIKPDHFHAWQDRAMILGGFRVPDSENDKFVSEPFDGRHNLAVECFDRALALNPADYESWYYRGRTLEKLCHQAQVRNRTLSVTGAPALPFDALLHQTTESFDRALALKPDSPQAIQAKAALYEGLFGTPP